MFQWRKQKAVSATATDAELVRAARNGDKRAFVEIVSRHQAMVCGVALGVLADFAASEDAAQEAFLTAWRKIHDLRDAERLRPWLAQIARNAALAHLRRVRGHDVLDEALAVAEDCPGPDERVALDEECALVRDVLERLPETYRLPLILFYREGHSVHAVAETLGLSEDAVKQRLARGREMLRERMTGLVETVLTRTRPTAVFTIGIAAAIGALAAPTVVASAAFAGTSATAASVSQTLFTAMSASKTSIATAAIIAAACIPVGYYVAAPTPGLSRQPANALAMTEHSTDETNRVPRFENSQLFAEWRQLHDIHGTTAEAMPVLYQAISELKDAFRRRAFRAALIAEWVQLDPAGGLKFLAGRSGDSSQRQQFFDEWLTRDPNAAVNALLSEFPGWQTVARQSLKEIARQAPSRVPQIAARLPKPESYWDSTVRDAFAIVAEGGLASARAAAEAMEGPNREQALSGVALAWGKSDLPAAIAWAQSLPEGVDRHEIMRGALLGTAAVNPVAALESANIVPPGGRDGFFATTTGARVLSRAAEANYDSTVQWLAANPGRFSREDLLGMANIVSKHLVADPIAFLNRHAADNSLKALMPAVESAILNDAGGQRETIWEWLKTQPTSDATIRSLQSYVLQSAGWQEPTLAMKLATELPRTAEGDREVRNLVNSLWNGGQYLSRFDRFLEQAPERLRAPLAESAFGLLRPDNLDDAAGWANRVSLVPEANRPAAMLQLARAWTGKSPEEAIDWARTLPAGQVRTDVVGTIAQVWGHADAPGAAAWVDAMQPGPERDRSASTLAGSMADRHPTQALEWALSINDEALRRTSAMQVVGTVASRDPLAAQQLLATPTLAPETKTWLQQALERRTRK